MAAIGRSAGTRASVLRELHTTRFDEGPLGSFGFDRNGDMTPAPVTILRVTGSTPPDLRIAERFRGAVVDRVLTVPAEEWLSVQRGTNLAWASRGEHRRRDVGPASAMIGRWTSGRTPTRRRSRGDL